MGFKVRGLTMSLMKGLLSIVVHIKLSLLFLARLDEVQEELLYYPWRQRWRRLRR